MLDGMAGKSKRAKLVLTSEEAERLERLRRSQTAPRREVRRAEILWCYHAGETIAAIARRVSMTRTSVGKWVSKALRMGLTAGLKDTYHRPREPVITEAAKAWVVHVACSKPREYGYAAELWTRKSLAQHVRQHALGACRRYRFRNLLSCLAWFSGSRMLTLALLPDRPRRDFRQVEPAYSCPL
jgi:transposase